MFWICCLWIGLVLVLSGVRVESAAARTKDSFKQEIGSLTGKTREETALTRQLLQGDKSRLKEKLESLRTSVHKQEALLQDRKERFQGLKEREDTMLQGLSKEQQEITTIQGTVRKAAQDIAAQLKESPFGPEFTSEQNRYGQWGTPVCGSRKTVLVGAQIPAGLFKWRANASAPGYFRGHGLQEIDPEKDLDGVVSIELKPLDMDVGWVALPEPAQSKSAPTPAKATPSQDTKAEPKHEPTHQKEPAPKTGQPAESEFPLAEVDQPPRVVQKTHNVPLVCVVRARNSL